MSRFRKFALKRPFLFALVMIVIYSILGTLTYPIAYAFPDTEVGQTIAETIGKFIITGCWMLLLWRWGWLKDSGLTRAGSGEMWLVVIIIGAYKIITTIFAFTGDWRIYLPTDALTTVESIYALSTGLLEETMVRTLILMAMIQAWGSTKQGIAKSAVLSSAIFGTIHLFNLMIRPPGVVILQAIIVILPGLLYAALVLKYRSLWGAILIHGLTNAFLNTKISTIPYYSETNQIWFTWAIVLIPIVAYSIFQLIELPAPHTYHHIPEPSQTTTPETHKSVINQPG